MSGSWTTVTWGPSLVTEETLPEDTEAEDINVIHKLIENYFDTAYPLFEPEIIHAMDKDYFLPALKVLVNANNTYISPGYEAVWKDMELHAECKRNDDAPRVLVSGQTANGYFSFSSSYPEAIVRHDAPSSDCDCGIYGSVHLEELKKYLIQKSKFEVHEYNPVTFLEDYSSWERDASSYLPRNRPANKLCIIEPAPDAKVILCRKGWKASHAFISEIVGETIPVHVASNLLSIAWHRPIDVARLYENR